MEANTQDHKWLSGGGAMSALILATDWAATPLGELHTWPANLQTTVSLCLASNFPINIIWGPQAIQIYNAGYQVVCGDAHPRAIGESYRVTWASAWDAIGEPFEKASRGETSYLENQRMFLNRNGYLEETFFTFSLSPIRDDLGEVAGLFHPVTETTAAMLGERRMRALRDVASKAGHAESVGVACERIVEALSHYSSDIPFVMLYQYDAARASVTLRAATDGASGQAGAAAELPLGCSPWPLQAVLDTSAPHYVADVIARVGSIACADYPEATTHACILPIAAGASAPLFGFAVVGLSTRLPADDSYKRLVEMVGEAASKAIGNALAFELEIRQKEEFAELDIAKTAFFSNVSHEFRTPLTLMLGPLEESLADPDEPLLPRQRQRQERINRNALRLLKLVNTLLDFSRLQAGRIDSRYRPTDLARMTADLASIFRSAIEKAGITFTVDMGALGEPVFVDHDMWEKIVLNLLSNAFKFTHRGQIAVALTRCGAMACLSVRDSGAGIPASELPNLFQRFHRVASANGRTYEGSGIGLALISELVKLHGGSVSVESTLDVGSTFEVRLPLGSEHLPADKLGPALEQVRPAPLRSAFIDEVSGWSPEPPTGPQLDAASPATPVAAARILVVDDNADMRAYLAQLFAPLGEVEAVHDGEAAIGAIERCKPGLIVSDLMMPRLDGFGLLRWLRAQPPFSGIPFILLSAKAAEESRIEGLEMGADDFLSKPFSARELLARAATQIKLGEARRLAEIERNRLYEFFMRSPVPMVILIGAEHRFFLANEPYQKLIGRTVLGKTVRDILTAPESELFIPLLDKVYATGIPFTGTNLELLFPDEQGQLQAGFLDVSYQPFRETSGEIKGILAIVIDATERVIARRAIERAVADLTEERELREQFVTTLSHDLRTPLSVAHMGGVFLQEGGHDAAQVQAVAGRIVRNTARLDAMICNLLDANRLRASQPMPLLLKNCQLDQLLVVIAAELADLHGDRFRLALDAAGVQGQWDEQAIRRLVENLAGNAIKYGGSDSAVTIGLTASGDAVELSVHNEGNPISASEQVEIFAPFHRIDRTTSGRDSGWGVGLTLVKGLAEAQGGRVRVQSDAVHGTTFYVRLPVIAAMADGATTLSSKLVSS